MSCHWHGELPWTWRTAMNMVSCRGLGELPWTWWAAMNMVSCHWHGELPRTWQAALDMVSCLGCGELPLMWWAALDTASCPVDRCEWSSNSWPSVAALRMSCNSRWITWRCSACVCITGSGQKRGSGGGAGPDHQNPQGNRGGEETVGSGIRTGQDGFCCPSLSRYLCLSVCLSATPSPLPVSLCHSPTPSLLSLSGSAPLFSSVILPFISPSLFLCLSLCQPLLLSVSLSPLLSLSLLHWLCLPLLRSGRP